MSLCDCGHEQGRHAMNLVTHRCTGPCLAGAYGERGQWIGKQCECVQFRRAPEAY